MINCSWIAQFTTEIYIRWKIENRIISNEVRKWKKYRSDIFRRIVGKLRSGNVECSSRWTKLTHRKETNKLNELFECDVIKYQETFPSLVDCRLSDVSHIENKMKQNKCSNEHLLYDFTGIRIQLRREYFENAEKMEI